MQSHPRAEKRQALPRVPIRESISIEPRDDGVIDLKPIGGDVGNDSEAMSVLLDYPGVGDSYGEREGSAIIEIRPVGVENAQRVDPPLLAMAHPPSTSF